MSVSLLRSWALSGGRAGPWHLRDGKEDGGLPEETQQCRGRVPLEGWVWLALQVQLRLSLGCALSSLVKGQGDLLEGVSWASCGR